MERNSAAQVIIAVIPIVGIVMGSVVVFFYLMWNYKRQVLLIQTQRYERATFDLQSFSLFTGFLLGGVGLCLTIFLSVLLGRGMWLLGGIIPLSIGISLLLYFIVSRRLRN
ncbi:MAG: hypothetical protein LBC77_09015 [Spirochaetaceae bacterium]|jgi:hypothetical protein|nr:hypothetical protein [Spirochaetaceae bacterium]